MNQYLQALGLVKIRTNAILASLGLATSALLSIIYSQPSHALVLDKLLPQTTQTVTGLVTQVLTTPSLPTPPRNPVVTPFQSSSSPAAQAHVTPATPPALDSSVSTTNTQQLVDTMPLIDMNLQPIEFTPANYRDDIAGKKSTAHFAITASSQSSLLLQPTDQGWQFLGVLWYWWGIVAIGFATGVIFWRRKGQQLSYNLLSWRNTTFAD